MRKFIIAGLLAAALAPGMVQAQNYDRRDDRHDIRGDRRDLRDARHDYREDWRDYRRTNPSVYRGPAWVGPRGYAYRRIVVGHRFDPVFYDRRYWVDPYRYHLRPVPAWQRWVRYGNDVALIDIRSGEVVDINYGFFF